MNLHQVTLTLEVSAALTAALVVRKRPEHRPVAAFLWLSAVANDLARLALQQWVIIPAREAMRAAGVDPRSTPFTGWVRIACHIEGALFLLWPAGLAAVALWLYAKRRPWAVVAAYALGGREGCPWDLDCARTTEMSSTWMRGRGARVAAGLPWSVPTSRVEFSLSHAGRVEALAFRRRLQHGGGGEGGEAIG